MAESINHGDCRMQLPRKPLRLQQLRNRSARQAADSETEPKQKPRMRMRMTEPNEPTKSRDADSTPTVKPRRATRECAASVRSPRRFISNCSATDCLGSWSRYTASLVWNVCVCGMWMVLAASGKRVFGASCGDFLDAGWRC